MAVTFTFLILLLHLGTEQYRADLATISVEAVPTVTVAHRIEIFTEIDRTAESRESWARDYRWIAVRSSERGVDRVTSETCPQLRERAVEFQRLPPIQPATPATVVLNEPLPVNAIALGGFPATLTFRTFGGAMVTVSSSEAYGAWTSGTINALLECWAPLTP